MPDELRAPFQKPYLERGRHRTVEAPERPYLTLQLSGLNGSGHTLRGIVDSGADFTCLPLSIAKSLGYRNADLHGRTIQQVSGEILARQATEPLRASVVGLPGVEFDLMPLFIEDCQPLWGRADFFAAFERVAFESTTLVLVPR